MFSVFLTDRVYMFKKAIFILIGSFVLSGASFALETEDAVIAELQAVGDKLTSLDKILMAGGLSHEKMMELSLKVVKLEEKESKLRELLEKYKSSKKEEVAELSESEKITEEIIEGTYNHASLKDQEETASSSEESKSLGSKVQKTVSGAVNLLKDAVLGAKAEAQSDATYSADERQFGLRARQICGAIQINFNEEEEVRFRGFLPRNFRRLNELSRANLFLEAFSGVFELIKLIEHNTNPNFALAERLQDLINEIYFLGANTPEGAHSSLIELNRRSMGLLQEGINMVHHENSDQERVLRSYVRQIFLNIAGVLQTYVDRFPDRNEAFLILANAFNENSNYRFLLESSGSLDQTLLESYQSIERDDFKGLAIYYILIGLACKFNNQRERLYNMTNRVFRNVASSGFDPGQTPLSIALAELISSQRNQGQNVDFRKHYFSALTKGFVYFVGGNPNTVVGSYRDPLIEKLDDEAYNLLNKSQNGDTVMMKAFKYLRIDHEDYSQNFDVVDALLNASLYYGMTRGGAIRDGLGRSTFMLFNTFYENEELYSNANTSSHIHFFDRFLNSDLFNLGQISSESSPRNLSWFADRNRNQTVRTYFKNQISSQ